MKSIQEIFQGRFALASNALVQKLRPDPHNLGTLDEAYTEHWPAIAEPFDLMVLALGELDSTEREIWVGYLYSVQPSLQYENKYSMHVDMFVKVGVHDRAVISDAAFYGNRGGGGSRVRVYRQVQKLGKRAQPPVPEGTMEQRLTWVRKNHQKFRDPVWRHWEGRCAVTEDNCNGLLIASHIYPWSESSGPQKTDKDNGLLLCAPLDKLFDHGLISFDDAGKMLTQSHLTESTRRIFGLSGSSTGIRRIEKLTPGMKRFLKLHRKFFLFE